MAGQLRVAPDYAIYASEWDKRHALLLEASESGQTEAEIPRPALILDRFLLHGVKAPQPSSYLDSGILEYYGLETIRIVDDG